MMVPMGSVNNKSIGVGDLKALKCVCEVSMFIGKCKKLCCCALFLQFRFFIFCFDNFHRYVKNKTGQFSIHINCQTVFSLQLYVPTLI